MRHSAQRLISLVIAVALVFAALFIFVQLVRPTYADTEYSRGTLASKRNLVESQEKVVKAVKDALQKYDSNEEAQRAVSLALPLTPDEGSIFYEIQKLAELNLLSLQSFQAGAPTASGDAKKKATFTLKPVYSLNFQMKLVGSYENFKKFLDALETNVRLTDVKNVTVEPLARSSQNFYTFTLSVVTYYQSE